MRIVIIGSLLSLPIEAKHSADLYAHDSQVAQRELIASSYPTGRFNKTLAWTDKKINELKRSIYKNPLRYAAGLTAIAALIGVGIYVFKLKPAAVQPIMPLPTMPQVAEAIEPIAGAAQAVSLSVHIASASSQQQAPRQLLISLRDAVEIDIFKVECMRSMSQCGEIDLESFKQITNTNHIAELHGGLKKVKDAFMFVAGYAAKVALSEDEIFSLHGYLGSLRAAIKESLPLYN